MINEIILSDIRIIFSGFKKHGLLENWFWKIDPWKDSGGWSKPDDDIPIITVIRSMRKTVLYEEKELISKEKTGFFERRIYRLADDRVMWEFVRAKNEQVLLNVKTNREWNNVEFEIDDTNTQGSVAFEYLGQIMPFLLLKQNIISFHGVLMEYNGSGVIISAASGTGKTTHARLWRDYKNALIVNGDRAVCKHTEKGWIGYGTPWSGTSGEQINRSTPLKALVVLERAEENSAEVISGMEAFGAVFPHVLYPSWDKDLTGKAMDLLDDFMNHIPIIRLKCRPDVESVEVLNKVLEEL